MGANRGTEDMESIYFYLGFATLILVTFKLLDLIFTAVQYFLSSPIDVKTLGEWAIVTGASDGIGFALASELANRGLNILLSKWLKESVFRSIE